MKKQASHGDEATNSVVSWRARRLVAAGLSERDALQLARDPAVDLHQLLGLIDRGCPAPLAVRITAPI